MNKKMDVTGQMILAAIPIIVTPLYAFYRIKEFRRGVLVMLLDLTIGFAIFVLNGEIDLDLLFNEELSEEDLAPTQVTTGFVTALIVDILLPLYFVKKWTIEYNEKIESSAHDYTESQG